MARLHAAFTGSPMDLAIFPIKRSQMSQCFCGVRAQQAERFAVTAILL